MTTYKIVVDNGKPYEVIAENEKELIAELKSQYLESQIEDYAYFDVKVYDEKDEDISESQFITELIGEIMGESEK